MTKIAKTKNHIKMYAGDGFIDEVKALAEKEGVSQSALLVVTMKKELRKSQNVKN